MTLAVSMVAAAKLFVTGFYSDGLEQPCNPGGDFLLDDWRGFGNV
jgi:hypothetical protein